MPNRYFIPGIFIRLLSDIYKFRARHVKNLKEKKKSINYQYVILSFMLQSNT